MNTPAAPPGQPPTFEDLTCRSPKREELTLSNNINAHGHITLDNGLHNIEPQYDLGEFERLPLEILQEILAYTNLRTLTDFRLVSQRAMQVVDSIPRYQIILKHGKSTLQGVLAIQSGLYVSCNDLCNALIATSCQFCRDSGGYIHLPTATRVCLVCLIMAPQFAPMTAPEIKKRFGLDVKMIRSIPQFKSLPGCYTMAKVQQKSRTTLYDSGSAFQIAQDYWDSQAGTDQNSQKECAKKELEAFQTNMRRTMHDTDIAVPTHFMNSTPPFGPQQNKIEKKAYPKRFMAVVRAPWVDPPTDTATWGFYCYGCQDQRRVTRVNRTCHPGRLFTRTAFEQHLVEGGPIIQGAHSGLQF